MTDIHPRQRIKRIWADLPTRLLTIAVGAPVTLTAVWVGAPLFDLLLLAVGGVAMAELAGMIRSQHKMALAIGLLVMGLAFAFQSYGQAYLWMLFPTLVLMAGVSVGWSRRRGLTWPEATRQATLYPMLGALYIGVPLGMLACLRHSPHGLGWILVIVWNTWFTDSFALLGGRAFGHHLLAPKLSPNKTYEGALIGVLAGTLVGGMMTVFVFGVSVPLAFGLNLMISALTIVGDLIESAVKRGFGVKDAGHLLPGHGGVLDRIDGFLVSTPFFVLALMAFGLL